MRLVALAGGVSSVSHEAVFQLATRLRSSSTDGVSALHTGVYGRIGKGDIANSLALPAGWVATMPEQDLVAALSSNATGPDLLRLWIGESMRLRGGLPLRCHSDSFFRGSQGCVGHA
mmetsp:Transcript_56028/g.82307  ORF Transcript_56028/g.82307 Transcript_56028/m.82307 type:complete len:117 (+) Transcript_56028:365-715(+)